MNSRRIAAQNRKQRQTNSRRIATSHAKRTDAALPLCVVCRPGALPFGRGVLPFSRGCLALRCCVPRPAAGGRKKVGAPSGSVRINSSCQVLSVLNQN